MTTIANYMITTLTKAVNNVLSLDPQSKERLTNLAGKHINIVLKPFNICICCQFTDQGMIASLDEKEHASAKITGTPLQLAQVVLNRNERQRFFADDVLIEGDAEVANQIIELFDQLEIDWEEYLSKIVGDMTAHQMTKIARGVGNWLDGVKSNFTDDVKDYIHEEKNWLPNRETVSDFFDDIDDLRMTLDRIEARIQLLKKQLLEDEEIKP
jgi:ubiquinone biosynthesis accessory factor UbiJ